MLLLRGCGEGDGGREVRAVESRPVRDGVEAVAAEGFVEEGAEAGGDGVVVVGVGRWGEGAPAVAGCAFCGGGEGSGGVVVEGLEFGEDGG